MTKYEELVSKAENKNINVLEMDLGTNKKCGKYFHNKNENLIIINSNITDSKKYEVLTEELGHYKTTSGNIQEQCNIKNIKQEKRARNWGYEEAVGIVSLINAFEKGIKTKYELAEYLNITEDFLVQAIEHYKEKFGMYYQVDHYLICFEPNLQIVKLFEIL